MIALKLKQQRQYVDTCAQKQEAVRLSQPHRRRALTGGILDSKSPKRNARAGKRSKEQVLARYGYRGERASWLTKLGVTAQIGTDTVRCTYIRKGRAVCLLFMPSVSVSGKDVKCFAARALLGV
jgi:hypothetical protein